MAQGDREKLERFRSPDGLDVGQGASRGDVSPRRAEFFRSGRHTYHTRQLAGDLHLEQRGHRRGLPGDIVGIVEHGGDIADHAG